MPEATFTLDRLAPEKPEDNLIVMLGYAGAGEGKTWFLGTGGDRVAIIDTGATGLPTLKSKLFQQKIGSKPLVLSIGETKYDREGFITATAYDMLCDAIDWLVEKQSEHFDTIAINDTTYVRRFAMNKGLEAGAMLGKSLTLTKMKNLKTVDEAIDFGVQDFGIAMNLMEKFIAGTITVCRNAKKHFVMMAHERLTLLQAKDDKGKPILGTEYLVKETRPAFLGKTFPDDITGYFDLIWHFESVGSDDNIVFRARTRGSEEPYLIARTNYGGLFPVVLKNPNLAQVIECIKTGKPHPDYVNR